MNISPISPVLKSTEGVLFVVQPAVQNISGVWGADRRTRLTRPLFVSRVSCGFPSPAEDWIEGRLDLKRFLVQHPAATFFERVSGDSMVGARIQEGAILVVDRAVQAEDGDVIVARINDELCVKRLGIRAGEVWLLPDNPAYEPLRITEEMDFEIWGKACHVIHPL